MKQVIKVQDDGTVIRAVVETCPETGKNLLRGGCMVKRGSNRISMGINSQKEQRAH